jgi:hypothetical protein
MVTSSLSEPQVASLERGEVTRHPFASWQGGRAPSGYFKPSQAGIAAFFLEHGFVVVKFHSFIRKTVP